MPDMSGFEILRQLRSNPATARASGSDLYVEAPDRGGESATGGIASVRIVRKEDVSTRLSAQPFLDWLTTAGLSPPASA